jgi:hypothetical protein
MNGYKNAEGYSDPTAGQAFANICREEKAAKQYLPLVYIASPYAGDVAANVENVRCYCRFAVSRGCIPIAPHLHYPQFLEDSDEEQRELGLRFALILLAKCDALWVFGNRISRGMTAEIAKAEKRGMPIKYFNNNSEEVLAL